MSETGSESSTGLKWFWRSFANMVFRLLRHWFLACLFGVLLLIIAGVLGDSFGIPHLFRDDPIFDEYVREHGFSAWIAQPSIWSFTAATLLLVVILMGMFIREILVNRTGRISMREAIRFFVSNGWFLLLLLVVAAAFPPNFGDATGWHLEKRLEEVVKASTGVVIGILLALVSGYLLQLLYQLLIDSFILPLTDRWRERFSEESPDTAEPAQSSKKQIGVGVYFLLSMILVTTALTMADLFPGAGYALCILFIWIVLIYTALGLIPKFARFVTVIAVLVFYATVGDDRYINELPGFIGDERDYYQNLLDLSGSDKPTTEEAAPLPSPKELKTRSMLDKTELLDPKRSVDEWSKSRSNRMPETFEQSFDEKRGKMVVITTQGGAYRATFWTAVVIDSLIEQSFEDGDLPGLIDSTRLLTGASGGLVASAYLAAMTEEDQPWSGRTNEPRPIMERILQDIENARSAAGKTKDPFKTRFPLKGDSLTPIARQMLQRDIPRSLFWPFTSPSWKTWQDRGLLLERHWETLNVPFADLRDGEDQGWRPSLIISPMIADTGQPLLISNLELKPLIGQRHDAISLFDWFGDIDGSFKLATAVRMNAAFPYVSPAVSLPTTKRRRTVDAGYYDNYGVNTALAWLFQDDVIKFLEEETSGVLIIQIRAFPTRDFGATDDNGKAVNDYGKEPHEADIFPLPEWLTSPIAGISSARASSMIFRNNQQIERLRQHFEDPSFVETVTFENLASADQVGMSWYIHPREIDMLIDELAKPHNQRAMTRLSCIWQHGRWRENQSSDTGSCRNDRGEEIVMR